MRVPLSWLREFVPALTASTAEVATALIRAGLEVEQVHAFGDDVVGVVVGRVLDVEELEGLKKPIRYCHVDVGSNVHEVVCGATNFAVGDLVPFALPGASLPGGFATATRKPYGRPSACRAIVASVVPVATGLAVEEPLQRCRRHPDGAADADDGDREGAVLDGPVPGGAVDSELAERFLSRHAGRGSARVGRDHAHLRAT